MWWMRRTVFKFGIYNGIYFMDIFFLQIHELHWIKSERPIKVANIIIVFKHADNTMTPTEQMNSTLALQY